jgi:hypothetical protein
LASPFDPTSGRNYLPGDKMVYFGKRENVVYDWSVGSTGGISGDTSYWVENAELSDLKFGVSATPMLKFATTLDLLNADQSRLADLQFAYVDEGMDIKYPEIWQYHAEASATYIQGWNPVYTLDFVRPDAARHDHEVLLGQLAGLTEEVAVLHSGVRHMAAVQDMVSAPPSTAVAGDSYIVVPVKDSAVKEAAGPFKGHENKVAEFDGTNWTFVDPREGDAHYVNASKETWLWNNTAWVKQSDGSSGVSKLGDLTDVTATDPKSGEALTWTGQSWAPRPVVGGGGGAGPWFVEGKEGGHYHSRVIPFPAVTPQMVDKFIEFELQWRANNTTATNSGHPKLEFSFKRETPHRDLRTTLQHGGWHARAWTSYEQAGIEWFRPHNVSQATLELGYPTVARGGWWVMPNVEQTGWVRFSRNLTNSSWTDIYWEWRGISSNDHPIVFDGYCVFAFDIAHVEGVELSMQGQETVFATRLIDNT